MALLTDVEIIASKPKEYLVRVTQKGDPQGRVVRNLVHKKNFIDFQNMVKKIFSDDPHIDNFTIASLFKIDVATIAYEQIPNVTNKVTHPVSKIELPLDQVIMDLNDNQGWTREQIADWLDTLDEQPVFGKDKEPEL